MICQKGIICIYLGKINKFIQIANKLNISLQNLEVPKAELNVNYWKYGSQEKQLIETVRRCDRNWLFTQ